MTDEVCLTASDERGDAENWPNSGTFAYPRVPPSIFADCRHSVYHFLQILASEADEVDDRAMKRIVEKTDVSVLHLLLTEDCFVAANHGTPFTREGLYAACRVQKSPKGKHPAMPIGSPAEARAAIEAVWKAWIEDYRRRPDAPARHAAAERDLADQIKTLLLREMITNAHDACGGDILGGKGIGLRTMLWMCDRPRIHSGHLSFCFDRRLAQRALVQAVGKISQASAPLLRLPFPIARSKEPARIRKLIEQFDTVIVLPFRNRRVRAEFVDQWEKFVIDATVLMYLPMLDHIVWERDDKAEKSSRTWVRAKGRNAVRMIDEGKRTSPPRIRIRPTPKRH